MSEIYRDNPEDDEKMKEDALRRQHSTNFIIKSIVELLGAYKGTLNEEQDG